MVGERNFSLVGIVCVVVLLLLAFLGVGYFRAAPRPDITIEPAVQVIGKRTPVKIAIVQPGRGLSHVKVEFAQGDNVVSLAIKTYSVRPAYSFWRNGVQRDTFVVEVGRETITGLRAGNGVIRVIVDRAGTWLRHPDPEIQELTLPVRLAPPTLQITSAQTYVAQGGCEAVVYRVGESSVRDGVLSGSWWFPGYPLPGGGKQDRFSIFAVPYDMADAQVRLIASDGAGNQAEMAFIDKYFPKPIKADTIQVTDAFLNKVVPEIMSQSPEVQDRGKLLDNFLEINRDLRRRDSEVLKELAAKSRAEFLWSKAFQMMPNGKVMSAFADRRTYVYQGNVIDHQDHLGYDLAVTRQAPIPSSNSGVVVLARYFGIFGNAVVVDHGYGLMSLYGHLSSIAVKEGQKVASGDILGNTGETGLAGGDHLHFTMLLQGLPVNPVEWWDAHWIRDRVAKKLGPSFRYEP